MVSAPVGPSVVYPASIVSVQVDAFPFDEEMPSTIPDKNFNRIETKMPLQLFNFVFGSGPYDYYGKVFAADCTALHTDIAVVRSGMTLFLFDCFFGNPITTGQLYTLQKIPISTRSSAT
jgi:hypothetical protein